MRFIVRFGTLLAATLIALVLSTQLATAAGSFTFNVSFRSLVNSRTWWQNGGNTTITANVKCNNYLLGHESYKVTLWKDQWSDRNMGSAYYGCNRTLQYTWNSLPSGTYYFTITEHSSGGGSGTGSVRYP